MIGHALDLLDLVVVREDDGIPLLFQPQDLGGKVDLTGVTHRDEGDKRDGRKLLGKTPIILSPSSLLSL
jgi:hypothetical protein